MGMFDWEKGLGLSHAGIGFLSSLRNLKQLQKLLLVCLLLIYHSMTMKYSLTKKCAARYHEGLLTLPWPGFEPGLSRPQREVLTTIRSWLTGLPVWLEAKWPNINYATFTPLCAHNITFFFEIIVQLTADILFHQRIWDWWKCCQNWVNLSSYSGIAKCIVIQPNDHGPFADDIFINLRFVDEIKYPLLLYAWASNKRICIGEVPEWVYASCLGM